METLWLIIFVIVMIYRAYQKATVVKKDTQQDWEDEEMTSAEQKAFYPWQNAVNIVLAKPRTKSGNVQSLSIRPSEPLSNKAEFPPQDLEITQQQPDKVMQVQNEPAQLMPIWDSNNLINAIVLSELLQTPKCKQQRPKIL